MPVTETGLIESYVGGELPLEFHNQDIKSFLVEITNNFIIGLALQWKISS